MSAPDQDSLSEVTSDSVSGVWKTSLRLSPKVKQAVRLAALAEGVSMNEWMVRAVHQHVVAEELKQRSERDLK